MQGGTAIPSDADMDTYTKIGNYYCQSNTTAASLSNAPFTKAFALKAIYANGVQFPCQIYREYDTGRIAVRTSTNPTGANNSWNGYRYFSDDDTVLTNTQIDSLQTSAKSIIPAINEIGGNSPDANTLAAYNKIKDELWETWDSGIINTSIIADGPSIYIIGYKHTNPNFGAFIIMSYFAKRPAYAYISSGTWHGPVSI